MSAFPYVGQIVIYPSNFAPKGWVMCNGQILPITQYIAVFSLLGSQYGGDGTSNFALPNLQGAIAIHTDQFSGGGQYPIGATGGSDTVSLIESEIPSHTHTVTADGNHLHDTLTSPSGALLANASPNLTFSSGQGSPTLGSMSPSMIGVAGSSSPHYNLMPYLTMTFCIALQGIYPTRS